MEQQALFAEMKNRFYLMQWYYCTKMHMMGKKFEKLRQQDLVDKT